MAGGRRHGVGITTALTLAVDMRALLRCLCTPGALPPGAAVELACFGAAFSAGAVAQASSTPPDDPAQGARATPAAEAPAPARVRLTSLAQCQVGIPADPTLYRTSGIACRGWMSLAFASPSGAVRAQGRM